MPERVVRTITCADADEFAPAFVLGALEADEIEAVRRHLADCANDHAEFKALGSVVPALQATVEPVEPPAELGARIMDAARAERASRVQPAWRPTRPPAPAPVGRAVRSPRRVYVWVALGAAAVLVIAALGIWNLQLRAQVDELVAYRSAVVAVLDRAASEGGQFARLAPPEGSGGPAGVAGVGADGSVAVAMRDLVPTSGSEVYELWVIGSDGRAVAVADFRVGASRSGGAVALIGSTEAGVTVALTREPAPGATSPTMPIVALGTARPAGG